LRSTQIEVAVVSLSPALILTTYVHHKGTEFTKDAQRFIRFRGFDSMVENDAVYCQDLARDTSHDASSRQRADEFSKEIIGAAIEVHRRLGPGLLESAYEECLCCELELRGIEFKLHGESQKGDAHGNHAYESSVYARSYPLESCNRDQI
jgi:hypothetical protein